MECTTESAIYVIEKSAPDCDAETIYKQLREKEE